MKIDYISSSSFPSKNANSVQVAKMCSAFAAESHQTRLFARFLQHEFDEEFFFKNYSLPNACFSLMKGQNLNIRYIWHAYYCYEIIRQIKESYAPDLFYSRYAYGMLACASIFSDVPFIYEVHALPRNRIEKYLESKLLKRTNFQGLVAITSALKQDYLNLFPFLPSEKIIVAPDGADIPKLSSRKPPKLKDKTNRKRVCYAGRLTEGKGMGLITELANLRPRIAFHVFGGSESEMLYWEKRAKSENIFFYGHVNHSELLNYYSEMDVFLAPLQRVNKLDAKYDIGRWTSPLKLFEYMAYGKPIIASDIPVLKEILSHEKNCLLAPPNDTQAWAISLDRIIEVKGLAKRIGRTSQLELLNNYTWSKRVKKILSEGSVSEI